MHLHRLTTKLSVFVVTLAGSLLAQTPAAGDRSADLRSKSIDARLEAIDWLATADRTDADALLLPLLNDKDWEVQERTARALGKRKSKAALKALLALAIEGDVRRVRDAAALALPQIDAAEAAASLFKRAKAKTQVEALEALAMSNRNQAPFADGEKLTKLLRDESAPLREAAAIAWLECAADRKAALRTLVTEPFLAVRCRALDAVAEAPREQDATVLTELFQGASQNEVVERRILRAVAALIATAPDRGVTGKVFLSEDSKDVLTLARRAHLVPLLTRGDNPVLDQKAAVQALEKPLVAADGIARAAAAKAMREVGGELALKAVLAHFPRETDSRVQLQLVETVAALRTPTTPEAVKWLVDIVRGQMDDSVRERAIVRLGRSGVQGAAEALTAVLDDQKWTLAACAAVSLGMTDDDLALQPLLQLLKHRDWTRRGAAVVGLMHWNREAVVEPLIGMLADAHPVVVGATHSALATIAGKYDVDPDAKAWRAWWSQNKGKHQFVDRGATIEKQKKYGYAVSDKEIYDGLDVIVFQSRGDHIEQLLDRLTIAYRKTQAGHVMQDRVHPEAIFVSNCTGELQPDDVEPLAWFVRTGGSLFGSCWALSETIARIHPGVMQKAATRVTDVLGNVRAQPCRAQSALLTGVFPPGVVPIYHLEGAHLIQVLDPERCEVLIDSPDAAEEHGTGNLAAWFFSGHGVILDSVNHFDLQGFEMATGLKTDKDRQAYAVDHMGLTFDNWRTTRTEGYWKSPTKASKSVPDLSAFRLLTNFVRSKRMGEY